MRQRVPWKVILISLVVIEVLWKYGRKTMIDRAARNEAIAAFEAYLDDKIMAFEFDDRLQAIETEDETVGEVVAAAWFHYDDCKDHQVVLSKQEWDYFQRLLLLLQSDAEFRGNSVRRWSWDHAIAWLALSIFVVLAFFIGWGTQLLVLSIPFGLVSFFICRYREIRDSSLSPRDVACEPYVSFSQIRWVRERVPAFRKRPYRAEIADRGIRSELERSLNRVLSIPAYLMWFLLAPLILFFQGFSTPERRVETLTE